MAPDIETISKDDLFPALASMGVKLPKSSKMSHEDLTRRLRDALNSSQRASDIIEGDSLNPSNYAPWGDNGKLVESTHRGSFKRSLDNIMSGGVKQQPSTDKENTFIEVQQILLALAQGWALGRRAYILTDAAQVWAVIVQLLDVHQIDERTPLYTLGFRVATSIPNKTLKAQLEDIISGEFVGVSSTELERRVLLKLLRMNAKRLDPAYQGGAPSKSRYTKKKWKMSFLLPIGPLPMIDIGKLTNVIGCETCGSTKSVSRCTQCLSVLYCSTECQTQDWPRHKSTCRSLKGGTWTTITFGPASSFPTQMPGPMYTSLMNLNESPDYRNIEGTTPVKAGDIPPNIHGDKIFLAKFQVSLFQFGEDAHFLIYDRQRSFKIFWKQREDPEAFSAAQRALADDLKIYRFAKRINDRQMSVCFDRAPAENPPW